MFRSKKSPRPFPKFWSIKLFLTFLTLWIVGNFIMVEGWRDCCERRRNLGKNDRKYGTFEFEVGRVKVKMECDQIDDGAATVIQRRWYPIDNSPRPDPNFFNQGWKEYENGFGEPYDGKSYWLGLKHIAELTKNKDQSIMIYMERFENDPNAYGTKPHGGSGYENFHVGGKETNYTLHLSDYKTVYKTQEFEAGDALLDPPYHEEWNINGMQFSTPDRDNDGNPVGNCAERFKGGWWYSCCGNANPNGIHYRTATLNADGIVWGTFQGWWSIRTMRMVIVNKDKTKCGLAKREKNLEL